MIEGAPSGTTTKFSSLPPPLHSATSPLAPRLQPFQPNHYYNRTMSWMYGVMLGRGGGAMFGDFDEGSHYGRRKPVSDRAYLVLEKLSSLYRPRRGERRGEGRTRHGCCRPCRRAGQERVQGIHSRGRHDYWFGHEKDHQLAPRPRDEEGLQQEIGRAHV